MKALLKQHHEVFQKFELFRGEIPGGFDLDSFLGTKNRQVFQGQVTRSEDVTLQGCYPNFDEEYFEWIYLLESVVAAQGSYTMIELGAGFGRWSVRAAHAVKQYNSNLPFRLIAVEAEPVHFEWMGLHFNDNGIDPSKHRLIHAAVSETGGRVLFCIGGPRGTPLDLEPNAWYGQCLTQDNLLAGKFAADGEYHGFQVLRHKKEGWRSIKVLCVSLTRILKDLVLVDLIDMDIEGQELPTIRAAIEELDAKVKRLHIGTHGKEIEAELRQLLSAHGWRCQADYTLFSSSETPWGTISFENGVQSWVNPRL